MKCAIELNICKRTRNNFSVSNSQMYEHMNNKYIPSTYVEKNENNAPNSSCSKDLEVPVYPWVCEYLSPGYKAVRAMMVPVELHNSEEVAAMYIHWTACS